MTATASSTARGRAIRWVESTTPTPVSPAGSATPVLRSVMSGAVVLGVRGEVDLATSSSLQRVLLSQLHDAGQLVIVDVTGVSFLGAAGLTMLVNLKQAAIAEGITLCLVAGTHVLLLPLRITGLDGEFDIRPEFGDAPFVVGDGPNGQD